MSKLITLNKNKEFLFAYRKGKSFVHPILVTYLIKNRVGINRIGITTSKKIGNAVKRNRARRIIKASFRELELSINTGYDIIFVARGKTTDAKMNDIYKIMDKHLTSIKKV